MRRVHASASGGYGYGYRHGIVGTVNLVRAVPYRQAHLEVTERVIPSRSSTPSQKHTLRGVLPADRFGRVPVGMLFFRYDPGLPERRVPVHSADAHPIGDHYGLLAP